MPVPKRMDRSKASATNRQALRRYPGDLPASDYNVLVKEELLQELGFVVCRRMAICLTVRGKGSLAERTELRATTEHNPDAALSCDQAGTRNKNDSEAALSPQEDRT